MFTVFRLPVVTASTVLLCPFGRAAAGRSAFAFLNVAALAGLSRVLVTRLSALVLAAVWMGVGAALLFGVMGRARQWLWWIVLKAPPNEAVEELERKMWRSCQDDSGPKSPRPFSDEAGPRN